MSCVVENRPPPASTHCKIPPRSLLEYPKGFLVSYSTSFGNDSPSFTRYMGKKATLENIGGEGSPRYQLVEEKGTHEDDPDIDQE